MRFQLSQSPPQNRHLCIHSSWPKCRPSQIPFHIPYHLELNSTIPKQPVFSSYFETALSFHCCLPSLSQTFAASHSTATHCRSPQHPVLQPSITQKLPMSATQTALFPRWVDTAAAFGLPQALPSSASVLHYLQIGSGSEASRTPVFQTMHPKHTILTHGTFQTCDRLCFRRLRSQR